MVNYAREHDFDAIIMVDDDMSFPVDTFVKLVKDYNAGMQVVSCLYHCKDWPYQAYISLKERPTDWLAAYEDGKIYEVFFIGTGAIIIDMKVFDVLAKPYFLLRMDLDGRITATEDCYFAENCYIHGIKCYVDTNIRAEHLKFVEIPALFEDPYVSFRGKIPFREGIPIGNVHEQPRTEKYRPPVPIINEPVEGFYWQDGIDNCAHSHCIELPVNSGMPRLYKCNDCGYVGSGLEQAYQPLAKELGGIPNGN